MAGENTLEELKSLVSEKYLGKAGIHGVGIRRSKEAVTIYVHPEDSLDQKDLLDQIEKEIEPFNLLVVEEEKSKITNAE